MKKHTDLHEPEKYIKGIEDVTDTDLSTWTVDDFEEVRKRLDLLRDQCEREKDVTLRDRAAKQYVRLGKERQEQKNKSF